MKVAEARRRVVLEKLSPEVDAGRFPVKRCVGEEVRVEVDMFADGQDALGGVVRFRHESDPAGAWAEVALRPVASDRWYACFQVSRPGSYRYSVTGWTAPFDSWRHGLEKKAAAGLDLTSDLEIGAAILDDVAGRASGDDRRKLQEVARALRADTDPAARAALALDGALAGTAARYPDRTHATDYPRELEVVVERERARYGAWYEIFPRSCSPEPGRHGTLRDLEARLDYVAGMGFDVLYLPPIHPVGRLHRKGRNNTLRAGAEDPGSPWAIGAEEGGHKAIDPQLGTFDDFAALVESARRRGLEVALDIAFQCAPDHPYVREHPEWFRHRPDGSIQYAENPPKKYEDIYPFDFETEHAMELWRELKDVVRFWIDQGVRILRVDNPHTKPFPFWEWLIREIRSEHPDVVFLSEAFTRPKVMYRLAKLGFSQSYTYFAWRNTKWELTEYFTELTRSEVREYFRPNLWPNTPDILTEFLQAGGRPAFMSRLILAATLGASYGIYGPAFELCENEPREPGKEEYLNSEKYEIKSWDLDRPTSLRDLIARLNRARRDNRALHANASLTFHAVDNEQLIAYSKRTEDGSNIVLVVVNLDPHHVHSGWIEVPLELFGLEPDRPYQVHDLLTDARYLWQGPRNYVELNPAVVPGHVFRVRRRISTERDFDYYM